jgi:hypothetical protein
MCYLIAKLHVMFFLANELQFVCFQHKTSITILHDNFAHLTSCLNAYVTLTFFLLLSKTFIL